MLLLMIVWNETQAEITWSRLGSGGRNVQGQPLFPPPASVGLRHLEILEKIIRKLHSSSSATSQPLRQYEATETLKIC